MSIAVAALWALALTGSSSALPSNCAFAASTVTCTFAETGAAQGFVVPAGVTAITVNAYGATGASPDGGEVGGQGAHVRGTLPVTPGSTLEVFVGGAAPGGGSEAGGFNGGGGNPQSFDLVELSGGGGGATDVRTSPYALGDRLIVAGGGGGGAGSGANLNGDVAGGNGGQSAHRGAAGTDLSASVTAGHPGLAGGTSAGGNGGSGGTSSGASNGPAGSRGSLGQGGAPGVGLSWDGDGGGGGGGYYGGGGGGAGGTQPSADQGAGGGGGGGGSNFIEASATGVSMTNGVQAGDGKVTIAYTASKPAITSASSTTFQEGHSGDFTVSATGIPTPSLLETGALPSGVSFTDNGNGTVTLSGTPAAGTGGSYPLTISASNGIAPDASQSFTLTVEAPPSVSISAPANGATYTQGRVVDASYNCAEGTGGPGITSCAGPVATGAAIDTSAVGLHSFSVTATSSDGQTATTTVSYTVVAAPSGEKTPAPSLSHLKVKPHSFIPSTKGKTIGAKVEGGAKVTYSDSLAAITTFRVYREVRGECKVHGKRKRCTKLVPNGKFTHHDAVGTNRLKFTGRVRGHALKPGNYELKATASMSGQRSGTVSAKFTIKAPPPGCTDSDHDGDCDAHGQK